jgi:hypothetical protein
MRERLRTRLAGLQDEFQTGQNRLRELEVQEALLRERLLMLKGAIQALQELDATVSPTDSGPGDGQPVDGRIEDDHAVDIGVAGDPAPSTEQGGIGGVEPPQS